MDNIPPLTFWATGQSFIILAPESDWSVIDKAAIDYFKASPFDITRAGQEQTITIAESRTIESEANKRPSQGPIKLCFLYNIDSALDEAANALLKIIEEPPPYTRFVLFASTRHILPTIRSRCSSWTAQNSTYSGNVPLLPLDRTGDFATVSLSISKAVAAGNALVVIDQWTHLLLRQENPSLEALHWLIESRHMISNSAVNPLNLLESLYLHLAYQIPLPSTSKFALRSSHGNI